MFGQLHMSRKNTATYIGGSKQYIGQKQVGISKNSNKLDVLYGRSLKTLSMGFSFLLDYIVFSNRASSFGLEHRHSHYLEPFIFRVLYYVVCTHFFALELLESNSSAFEFLKEDFKRYFSRFYLKRMGIKNQNTTPNIVFSLEPISLHCTHQKGYNSIFPNSSYIFPCFHHCKNSTIMKLTLTNLEIFYKTQYY